MWLHVSVYIDHPQAHLSIVFLQLLATYWDPAMFTNYASVHACYKYIKLGVKQWYQIYAWVLRKF